MRLQVLLLSLIILISLLFSRDNNDYLFKSLKGQDDFSPGIIAAEKDKLGEPKKLRESYEFSASLNEVFASKAVKVNEERISFCQLDQSNFNDFTSKAILIKYLDLKVDPGQTIFELNPQKRWPIASLTKLMTAVVAREKMDLAKEVIITEKSVAAEGAVGEFKTGEAFRLEDLIKAMLVSSSNDAAIAIAENFGEENFIGEMQKKAAELQMFSTTYLEPSGLSFVSQSTITDLAKLINYIYFHHPEIIEISRQKEVEILELKSNKPRKLLNTNKFAGEADFVGGKTGYIEAANRNLISLFNINNQIVLIIVLGADDSFKEIKEIKEMIRNC